MCSVATSHLDGATWAGDGGRAVLRLGGGNGHVDIPPLGVLAHLHAGSYSVVARFRPAALPSAGPGNNGVGEVYAVIAGRTGWTLGLYLDGTGRFLMQNFLADRSPCGAQSATGMALGRWYALAGTVDRVRGETRLAIDGRVVAQSAWTPGAAGFDYPAEAPWRLGISTLGTDNCRWPATGDLRDVRLYDRVLDDHDLVRLAEGP